MKIIFALVSLLFLSLPGSLQAQKNAAETGGKDKFFVSVPVVVSDREGHYIAGLKKEDFTIFQNGVKQKITFFSMYNEPLKIALLLDTSKSSRNVIDKIKDAAEDFVGSLNRNDECQVATFDSQLKIINPFTSNRKIIKNSLDKVEINDHGGTLMYDAVRQLTQKSFDNVKGRKVIVLLTDGNDFGSSTTKSEFLSRLEESDVMIYTVFFKTGVKPETARKNKKPKKAKKQKLNSNAAQAVYIPTEAEIRLLEQKDEIEAVDALKKMSDITAGRFYVSGVPDLKKVFKDITGELSQQYRLGFDSKNSGGAAVHDIIVKVDRADAVIRTRGTFQTKQK